MAGVLQKPPFVRNTRPSPRSVSAALCLAGLGLANRLTGRVKPLPARPVSYVLCAFALIPACARTAAQPSVTLSQAPWWAARLCRKSQPAAVAGLSSLWAAFGRSLAAGAWWPSASSSLRSFGTTTFQRSAGTPSSPSVRISARIAFWLRLRSRRYSSFWRSRSSWRRRSALPISSASVRDGRPTLIVDFASFMAPLTGRKSRLFPFARRATRSRGSRLFGGGGGVGPLRAESVKH